MTFKKYSSQLEEIVDKMLEIADDQCESFAAFEKNLMEEVIFCNEIASTYKEEIKTFHRLITSAQARESLVPLVSDLNASFRVQSSPTIVPKLKKIQISKFDGDLLKFPNFKS